MKNRIVFAIITCIVIALSSSCVSTTQDGNAPKATETTLSQDVDVSLNPDSTVTEDAETNLSEAPTTPTTISFLDSLDSSNGNISSFEELMIFGKGVPRCMKVSPKEDLIAIGSSIGVWLYNYDDLSLVTHLDGKGGYVNDIDWSPSGLFLAVANGNGTVHIWDVKERIITNDLYHGATELSQINPFPWSLGVSSVDWSPDGRNIVSGGYDGYVRLWNPNTRAELHSYVVDPKRIRAIWDVSWSSDSQRVAIVGDSFLPGLWAINTNEVISIDDIWETAHVNWSPNNDLVAIADYEGVTLVNSENVKDKTITDIGGFITDSSISKDGRLLAVSRLNGDVLVWDIESNELAQSLDPFPGIVESIDWSPDSDKIILITRSNVLWIWNTKTWELLEKIEIAPSVKSSAGTTRFDWSPNEELIALYTAEILDIETGEIHSQLPNPTNDLAWSPDSNQIAFLPFEEDIVVWNIEEMEEASRITTEKRIDVIDWSPNGTVISHARYDDPNVLELFNLKDLVSIREITYPESSLTVGCHSWSPDGNLLASWSYEGGTLIYDSIGEVVEAILENDGYCKRIKWLADGRFLFKFSSEVTRIYDAKTWESVYFSLNHPADILDISNNGNYLAIGNQYLGVSIINIKTDETIAVFEGHTDKVELISWSPNDTMIATSGRDGTLRVWGVAKQD